MGLGDPHAHRKGETYLIVALAGLLVAAAAVVLTLSIEWLKRPRLEIVESVWQPKGPTQWVFAIVHVRNRRMSWPAGALLVRESAKACEVVLEFRKPGGGELVMPEVAARWSSHPEPFRAQLVLSGTKVITAAEGEEVESGPTFINQYDPMIVPQTRRLDVAAGDAAQEVAIAVLRSDGSAHAFGADSYEFLGWKHPDRELERQVYEVTVRVLASGVSKSRRFKLDNLAPDFGRFSRLEVV